MPTYILRAPNGKDVEATGDHYPTDEEKAAIFRTAGVDIALKDEAQGSGGGLPMFAAAKAVKPVADALYELGSNPDAGKALGNLVKNATTLGGVVHGAATLNPAEVIAAPKVGWAAGRGGYWLGKNAQSVIQPVATALDASAKPIASALTKASGAQGLLDLAQMAEPTRKDIGTLGVTLGDPHDPEHPALVNLLLSKASEGISKYIEEGMSTKDALAAWLKGKR